MKDRHISTVPAQFLTVFLFSFTINTPKYSQYFHLLKSGHWEICLDILSREGEGCLNYSSKSELLMLEKSDSSNLPYWIDPNTNVQASLGAQQWRICLPLQETWVQPLCLEGLLEKEMAISTPVFLSGRSYGQRTLVGYSPGGRKMSDMTWSVNHNNHNNTEVYLVYVLFWI